MEMGVGKSVLAVLGVLCVLIERGVSGKELTTFNKYDACKLQERLDLGLAELKSSEHSGLVRCATACMDQCSGVSVDKDNNCYHHRDSNKTISCVAGDPVFQMYHKNPCEHDGLWNPTRLTCKCVNGWVGYRCERYPRHCGEMAVFGYASGTHKPTILHPENYQTPFLVYCSYDIKNPLKYLTFLFKNTGTYDNTMTWNDYVNGFYKDTGNYWIGLEKIKVLTDIEHTYMRLRTSVDLVNGSKDYHEHYFTKFHIESGSAGYMFNVTKKNTPLRTDCMSFFQGVPFSTADHDNDMDSKNCAREGKAGWWFKTCNVGCNPFGPKTYRRIATFDSKGGNGITDMFLQDGGG